MQKSLHAWSIKRNYCYLCDRMETYTVITMKRRVIFFLIVCMAGFCAYGQDLNIRHYTINNGMQTNAVYSITQDSNGKMWFGTIDGLHSYDGNKIKVWSAPHIPSLGSIIYAITEDDSLNLWVGTNQGLSRYNLQTESFSPFNLNCAGTGEQIVTPIGSLLKDSRQQMWIGTLGQGIFRYDPKSGQLKRYSPPERKVGEHIYCLKETRNGEIWAINSKGISRYLHDEDRFEHMADNPTRHNLLCLYEDSRQNLYAGSNGSGLFRLKPEKQRLIQVVKSDVPTQVLHVRSIVEHQTGELLLATDEGLMKYDTRTHRTICLKGGNRYSNSLNDGHLQTLYIDRERSLWVGTYFGGVNYLPYAESGFIHHRMEDTGPGSRIVGVLSPADNGNLWIGTDDSGFFYWNRKENSFIAYNQQSKTPCPTYHNIHALLQDGDTLYVGMYMGGLDILNLKTGQLTNHQYNASPRSLWASGVYALCKDSRQRIWVGTTNGLNRYCPDTGDFERIGEVRADVSSIMEDRDGTIWVTSHDNGVYGLPAKGKRWRHFTANSGKGTLPTNSVITISQADDGTLWAGTDGHGLARFDTEQNHFVPESLSQNIRVVQKIIPEGNKLWLTTSNGVYCYLPEQKTLTVYNKLDGLQENLFLPNSGLKLPDGTLFIGGINGFNQFHPGHMPQSTTRPNIILSELQIFNRPVKAGEEGSPLTSSIAYTDRLTLKHHQSIFSLSVASLSYINPLKAQYRYKLEGLEERWNECQTILHATYTNLTPGNYTFRVNFSNGNGKWEEDVIALPIRILPPWWLSPAAYSVYFLLLAGSAYAALLILNRRHRKRMELMSLERDKEIYQNKINFFTQMIHEIRTPLTLILSPLESVMQVGGSVADAMPRLQMIERNGKRLLNLVNQLMDFRKTESGKMVVNLRSTNLNGLLSSICQRFIYAAEAQQRTIEVSLPQTDCFAMIDEEALIKVMSNLLSNAMKFTSTHIWVSMRPTNREMVEIEVRNNGAGISTEEQANIFTPFYQIKEKDKRDNVGTGIGLTLVKKLVELMEGELDLKSTMGQGSAFCIRFRACEAEEAESAEKDEAPAATPARATAALCDATLAHQQTPLLLIVDDSDELRHYLCELLKSHYRVESASDGESALKKLHTLRPDLIITDIMMPGIDGIELCKRVKQNLNTSHIPVLLLTAKSETGDYTEGLRNGADGYLIKPFSSEVIEAQIVSLLQNRKQLKQKFCSSPTALPDIVADSEMDKKFLKRVSQIIEERISNPSFGVEELAREAGISRTGLFTKLKSLSDMTPNEYITLIRLKKAAQLLRQPDIQVGEVCYLVGYSSTSYFTKCFKAQFGATPIEFKHSGESQTG